MSKAKKTVTNEEILKELNSELEKFRSKDKDGNWIPYSEHFKFVRQDGDCSVYGQPSVLYDKCMMLERDKAKLKSERSKLKSERRFGIGITVLLAALLVLSLFFC